jgi:uncharacterized protein (TIGR04222 family)
MQHADLFARIEAFTLDDPGSSWSFSQRLARENGWSDSFVRRAIREYKRFAFLAIVAGHPVSPSEAVDEVWHLHLVYSRSYWHEFCGKVLGCPLHHQPTQGGDQERAKFRNWYSETLASYRNFFEQEPPSDIWPDVEERFASTDNRRIDLRKHWVIPKPRLPRWAWSAFTGLLLLALLAGCGSALAAGVPLLDWRGPDFLKFYLVALPIVLLLGFWLRNRLLKPDRPLRQDELPDDVYVLAGLAGGGQQIVHTAIPNLMQQGAIKLKQSDGVKVERASPGSPTAHPLERRILEAIPEAGLDLKSVYARSNSLVASIMDSLEDRHWIIREADESRIRFQPFAVVLLLPLLGIIKILVGLMRERPVGFLVALVVFSVVVAAFCFLRRPKRTQLGERALNAARSAYENERRRHHGDPHHSGSMIPLSVALFGLTALSGTAYASLQQQLKPAPQSQSTASGCGGASSCGGGGSGCGGGGGGGGGGCGGCGGS